LNRQFIAKHWYASVYEQFENHTNDIEFLLKVLRTQTDGSPQKILEVACGGGRISVPLAQAGHNVTGFDADHHMLLRCYRRMRDIPNIKCYQSDALDAGWGENFDVVVMAGNILINIESDMDYEYAQRAFIRNASAALRVGGRLYLDYDQHSESSAAKTFNRLAESSYFKGTDDMGTTGRTVSLGGAYDPVTRIWTGIGHWELTTNNGEKFIYGGKPRYKHIPALRQVYGWLSESGFAVEKTYRNYTDEPISDDEPDYVKAVIWAAKI